MRSLFKLAGVQSNSELLKFTKDRMRAIVKKIREEEPEDRVFKVKWMKYKKHLMYKASDIRLKDDDYIINVMMAGAYALKKDMPKFTEVKELDTADLDKFLNFNLNELFIKSEKSFRKLRTGMKFVDGFTRKYYTDMKDGIKATEDSLINMFEVCCISLYIATPKTRMTTTRFFSSYTHASKNPLQFASNFNMLISAYLFQTYGLKSMKARGDNTLYLHSSSEGWLARMVSSLYVAVKNPNIQVKYRSVDPNIKVVEAFRECRDYLLKYTKVKNWEAQIINCGSEQEEANMLNKRDYKIDCSFTSPPYLDLEEYPDTALVRLNTGQILKRSYLDDIETDRGIIKTADLRVGDTIKANYFSDEKLTSKGKKVKRLDKTPQCASLYRTARTWNEYFLRPTAENIYTSNYKGGYLILNVVDFKKHKTMEADTVEICEEVGFTLKETLKYPLTRKPGKGEGGVRLADSKKPFEPIFVFQR